MKTELARVSEQLGLSYDKQVKVMWGLYKGYKTAVKEDPHNRRYYISLPIKASDYTQGNKMDDFIQSLSDDKKLIKKVFLEGYCLNLEVNMTGKAKRNQNNILSVLDQITEFARDNAYDTCCEICGEVTEVSTYIINGKTLCGCENCYSKTIDSLDDLKEAAKRKKGNVITGLVGALIGALIGVALWVAIYALGYIATICGIVLAVCIIKGFELFGGKLNLLGIVSTIAITIIMVYAATYISYGYSIYDAFKDTDNIDIFSAIRSVKGFISEYPEISKSFYGDLATGYLFTAVGTVSTFISAYQNSNGKYITKKLIG